MTEVDTAAVANFPVGCRSALCLSFDLDAETMWTSKDANNSSRPAVLSSGRYDVGPGLDLVLELIVDDDEVIRRLSGRRTCRGCGKIWHMEFDPPTHPDVCDRCGGELFQRDDDRPETIANRLREYADKTAPLIDFYGAQGKLVGIDATGPVEDVTVRAIDALRSYGG